MDDLASLDNRTGTARVLVDVATDVRVPDDGEQECHFLFVNFSNSLLSWSMALLKLGKIF